MIHAEIENLQEVLRKVDARVLLAPLKRFFDRVGISVASKAKQNAPVDTGRLRSSLTHRTDAAEPPMFVDVGTNVFYAPYMEFGTGLFAEGEGGKGGRHWPPAEALELWAQRHGAPSGAAVAAAIGKRGGLKPRRYLRDALRDSLSDIRSFVNTLGKEIGDAWEKK